MTSVPKSRRPHPLLHLIPPVLRDVTTDFQWELERLWRLDLEPTPVSIRELDWHFDLPLWQYGGRPFMVGPNEVVADRERYREQYVHTMAADLRYPLHFLARPERLTVLDGAHRLLKAHLLGHETVLVIKVPMDLLDDFAVGEEEAQVIGGPRGRRRTW